MDKNHKLQRYSHKDYSELVDFPVEIVGRDGVIRRYTFEDSIRLYQRRITFAPIRYRDRDLIDAEMHHCRHRIDQLRRSFFYRFGWGTPEDEQHPEEIFGDVAGELAAFIRRVLRVEGRPDVRLEPIEEGSDGASAWLLLPAGSDAGMLLYVYTFESNGPTPRTEEEREDARERFFAALKALEQGQDEGERMLAFHHAADCGFILTGQPGQFESLVSQSEDDGVIRDITPTRWDRLVDQIRLGQYQDALVSAQRLVKEQPLHRRGYVVGSALASFLGHTVEVEEMSLLGALHFPEDPDLQYWLGLTHWRQGRLDQASTSLTSTLTARPADTHARFLLFTVRFEQGRWFEAMRLLRDRSHRFEGGAERRGARLLDALSRATKMFALALGSGLVLSVTGLVLVPVLQLLALLPVVIGALFGVLAVVAFRHELQRLLGRQRFDDVPTWVRRAVREQERGSDLL